MVAFLQCHLISLAYCVEYTGSLPTSEVKRRRARLVLGWGTAWEHLRVLSAFPFFVIFLNLDVNFDLNRAGKEKNGPSLTEAKGNFRVQN